MKHLRLLTAILSVIALISCDARHKQPEWGTYPEDMAFVTVRTVESLEDADQVKYYFESDNGYKLFLADNQIGYNYELQADERIIISFTLIQDYSRVDGDKYEGAAYDCHYGLRLFAVRDVQTPETLTVTTKEESDAVANHGLSYIYNTITLKYGYINMLAGIKADKLENVKFYLVDNQYDEPDLEKEGYLNLEMRYDRGTDEVIGNTYDEYVSLSLEPFEEQLKDKKGVILRVRTINSGTGNITLEIDSDEEYVKSFAPVPTKSLML